MDFLETIRLIGKAACCERSRHERRKRPLGCYLVIGVPKIEDVTLFARGIAETVYGNPNALIRLDMSEYTEKRQIFGLLAHNGGLFYAWMEGELSDPILRNPDSVILLNNIHKVHQDFHKIISPILNEGRIFDGIGRSIEFENTIIIMATNAPMLLDYILPTELTNQIDEVIDWRDRI